VKKHLLKLLLMAAVLFLGRAESYGQTQNDISTKFTVGTGGTALMLAAANGHTETVKLLLDRRANINVRDNEGKTALEWARERGHTEIVELIEAASQRGAAQPSKNNTGNEPF